MSTILIYILTLFLFLLAIFFLIRTLVVAYSMFYKVPYVPSKSLFKEAIKHLDIKKGDRVLDIGSGDGRVLFYASKKYPLSSFVGVERNYILVMYSRLLKFLLKRENIIFQRKDILKYDISNFDSIYVYLTPAFVDEIFSLKTKFKDGCKLVSYDPLGKKFSEINKVERYAVKYNGNSEYIFKWVNNEDTRR